MAQHSAGNHDQGRGYMTRLVVNHGVIKLISIKIAVILPMIIFDVEKPWHSFRQEEKWPLAIC
jgi:hypothetical protein